LLKYFDLGTYGTACCMATDVNGDVYVVGSVGSNQLAGKVIAMKVDRTNNVVYQFTFGGSGVDAPKAVAVDAEGNLFVVGLTSSADFPSVEPAGQNRPEHTPARIRQQDRSCGYAFAFLDILWRQPN
jgi:hypothetical protein